MTAPNGKGGELKPVPEYVEIDVFENAIRRVGVVAACEWFGHLPDSEFTRDTIKLLQERSEEAARSGVTP